MLSICMSLDSASLQGKTSVNRSAILRACPVEPDSGENLKDPIRSRIRVQRHAHLGHASLPLHPSLPPAIVSTPIKPGAPQELSLLAYASGLSGGRPIHDLQ